MYTHTYEFSMTFHYKYTMCNDQIRVIGLSIGLKHLLFVCIENIQSPAY